MSRAWVGAALATMLFYSVSNFLSAVIGKEAATPRHAGKSNGQIQLLTEGLAGIATSTTLFVLSRGKQSPFWGDLKSLGALLVAGSCFGGGILILAIALADDFRMGPFITGVLPINAVFLVGLCWVLLGEKTTLVQLLAIGVAVIGLVVMATADVSSDGIRGILYGLLVAICFTIGNFLIKYVAMRGAISSHVAAVGLLWVGQGVVGLVFFVVETSQTGQCFKGLGQLNTEWGGEFDSDSNRLYCFSAISALTQACAIAFMKLTVSMGPTAPGMAIANANAIGVLALNHIFFHPTTNAQQIIGLLVCIVGVAVLSFAPKKESQQSINPPTESADTKYEEMASPNV